MQTFTAPVVGMHFRPPAKAILKFLQSGAALTLHREPENPYDANAVMVFVNIDEIPEELHQDLNDTAEPYGFSLAELLGQGDWHLGYIAKEFAIHLAPILDQTAPESVTLKFNMENKPMAEIAIEI